MSNGTTYIYDFVSKSIELSQVEQIISTAGYVPGDYTYTKRVDKDGYVVSGQEVMNITNLENAAKQLKIKVAIYSPNADSRDAGHSLAPRDDASMTVGDADADAAAAGTPYQVLIVMDSQTVEALSNGQYKLYGFKAVQASSGGGQPLVWFSTTQYSANTSVDWTEEYQAYTSKAQIQANVKITASFSTPINLGQTLNVVQNGLGTVVSGGVSTAITIKNNTDVVTPPTQFTCGISQKKDNVITPLCAFPLYPGFKDVIAPIQRVMLTFSNDPVNTGVVIMQSFSPGLMIDLTADNFREVSFNIVTGWSWGGSTWASKVNADETLAPLLIEISSPSLALSESSFRRRSLVLQ